MPDEQQKPADTPSPTDDHNAIRQDADATIDAQDTQSSIARIRDLAGLQDVADPEIERYVFDRMNTEVARDGASETAKAWKFRKDSDAWDAMERRIAVEMQQRVARLQPAARGIGTHPANRNFTSTEKGLMTDRDFNALKALEREWSEASPSERRDIEKKFSARNK